VVFRNDNEEELYRETLETQNVKIQHKKRKAKGLQQTAKG